LCGSNRRTRRHFPLQSVQLGACRLDAPVEGGIDALPLPVRSNACVQANLPHARGPFKQAPLAVPASPSYQLAHFATPYSPSPAAFAMRRRRLLASRSRIRTSPLSPSGWFFAHSASSGSSVTVNFSSPRGTGPGFFRSAVGVFIPEVYQTDTE